MREFIACPICNSHMRWDEGDGEYSCGACASVLSVPVDSRTSSSGSVAGSAALESELKERLSIDVVDVVMVVLEKYGIGRK